SSRRPPLPAAPARRAPRGPAAGGARGPGPRAVPLARALGGGRALVLDPLVSRHDTVVGDWRKHAPGSLQARWNLRLDRWTLGLADRVLCDTWAHGDLFASLGVARDRLRRVLVGAEDGFFAVTPAPAGDVIRIVYVGGFLPLHGVGVMLDAAALLEARRAQLPPFRIDLVGRGREFEASRARAKALELACVELPGAIDYTDLPRAL